MPDERLSAHQGYVNGIVPLHQTENARNKIVAAKIGKIAQLHRSTQMRLAIGIASWTTEGTFARNFDGKKRNFSAKDFAPGLQKMNRLHVIRSGTLPPGTQKEWKVFKTRQLLLNQMLLIRAKFRDLEGLF